jgi:uncharacterized membrane protein
MTSGVYLSTTSVVAILAGVALLAVLSALTLAPLGRYEGRYVAAFCVCLVTIWAGAVVAIVLIKLMI